MIKTFEIANFKSFPKLQFPMGDLTLLCGLNNTGKSSVLQALRMYCNNDPNSPLLPGYGSIDELRSKFSSPNESIIFNAYYSDKRKSGNFILSEHGEFKMDENAPLSCYLSADRWGPRAFLPMERKLTGFPSLGDHGEYVIEFLDTLRNLLIPERLHHDKSEGEILEYEIIGWLQQIAPGVSISYNTDTKRDSSQIEYNSHRPANVGFGLSYCLPILAAILGISGTKPSGGWNSEWGVNWEKDKQHRGILIMIENPEAHLHPSGQTSLGKLIALGAQQGIQILIETQSDHLMDGVRIAIKDNLIDKNSVVFHYLTKNNEGETQIETPEIDENGRLSHWPEGFFDQTLKNRTYLAS